MTRKIFKSIMLVSLIVLISSIAVSGVFLFDYFNKIQIEQLKEELSIVKKGVDEIGAEKYFKDFNPSIFRFTLIAKDGKVLFDSHTNPADMENHSDRQEIKSALLTGSGSAERYSSTLSEKTFYEATRLKDGDVLRISVSDSTVWTRLAGIIPAICAVIAICILAALTLSKKMANEAVRPLGDIAAENAGDDVYEELAPILKKINRQQKLIVTQKDELKRRAEEFKQITDSMSEGLILLDSEGRILSANESARQIFGMEETNPGTDFLTVDRSADITTAIAQASSGGRNEFKAQKHGLDYQVIVNGIKADEQTVGVMILCIDVTETVRAEKQRKEFTSNVSHELKTPLQSIIGSAELLENGLVKEQDKGRFFGNIKNEANRLLDLINDILRLGELDENKTQSFEKTDLKQIAEEVKGALSDIASKKDINIEIIGESAFFYGVRRYLYEIIYNLCDNAVRYNKDGGSITVSIEKTDEGILLTVKDTGIGIPLKYQQHVFERFFRVDKSHSRQTGGTGLGLSIVKRAVSYHNGAISLKSAPDVGTEITVRFPD